MLEFEFSAADLARTSFVLSPLWQLVCSLRVLNSSGAEAMYVPWVDRVRRGVEQLDERLLLRAIVPSGGCIPDFLTPDSTSAFPDLETELDAMRGTPGRVLRRDLTRAYSRRLPEVLEPIVAKPGKGLMRIAEALLAYWNRALAEDWPRIRDTLRNDITFRARQFTTGGAVRLFNDLHPDVNWSGDTLVVGSKWSLRLSLGGTGMVLMPSAFSWPLLGTMASPEARPTVFYPARGVATLWEDPRRTPLRGSVDRLIGGQRAAVLAALHVPTTTTELGRRLSITPGGISKHLSVLRDAGLVWSSRSGRMVLYARTALGESLAAHAR